MSNITKLLPGLVTFPNGKVGRSLLTIKASNLSDIKSLKYVPQQVASDVFQSLAPESNCAVSQETLQALVNKKLSLRQMSETLNLSDSSIRACLKKYNISRFSEETVALKKYFSTNDPKEKAKAFEVIDKSLMKIAKKETEFQNDGSFEDTLQNVRLRFLEFASKKSEDRRISVYSILGKVENSAPAPQPKIEKIGLDSVQNELVTSDLAIEKFETEDLFDFLLNNSNLSKGQKIIVSSRIQTDATYDEIAKKIGVGKDRVSFYCYWGIRNIIKFNFDDLVGFSESLNKIKRKEVIEELLYKQNFRYEPRPLRINKKMLESKRSREIWQNKIDHAKYVKKQDTSIWGKFNIKKQKPDE